MNKQNLVIGIALIVFILIIGSVLLQKQNYDSDKVCFKKNCFSAELALNEKQREIGLMNREHMDSDKGMLFVFENEGLYPFWMKSTLIPLDIIWINSSDEVVYIARGAQPCKTVVCSSINPGKNASYVLEINANLSDKYSIKEGDKVNILI